MPTPIPGPMAKGARYSAGPTLAPAPPNPGFYVPYPMSARPGQYSMVIPAQPPVPKAVPQPVPRHTVAPQGAVRPMMMAPRFVSVRSSTGGPLRMAPGVTAPGYVSTAARPVALGRPFASLHGATGGASLTLPTPATVPVALTTVAPALTTPAGTAPATTAPPAPASLTLPAGQSPQTGPATSLPIGKSVQGIPTVGSLHNMSDASTTERRDKSESPPNVIKGPDAVPAVSSSPLSHISRNNNNSLGLSSGGFSPSLQAGATPPSLTHSRTPSRNHIRQASVQWLGLEKMLYEQTNGAFHPVEMAQKRRMPAGLFMGGTGVMYEVPGRVSIVAPSMATRQHYHENLYRCFEAQDYPDKELIVIETYQDKPSAFLKQKAATDERLVHVAIKVLPGQDFPVGLKRNMTLHMATGEFIINFDDDDLYAPGYVKKMVGLMVQRRLIGVTLSAWYNYYIGKGMCTFSDPESWEEWADDQQELDEILYGYGFSYSHRRQPSLMLPYPNVGFAEDAPFFLKFREIFGSEKVLLYKDNEGLCVHVMHRANTAQVLGSRTVSAQDIASLRVADLRPFQVMIDNDFFRFSPWRPPVRLPALSAEIIVDDESEVQTVVTGHDFTDVIPRLRASTLEGPGEFGAQDPPTRPRANTFRNSEDINCIEL